MPKARFSDHVSRIQTDSARTVSTNYTIMSKKYLTGFVNTKAEEKEDGILSVAVATDGTQDRDGEVVMASGVDLSNFKKNPVLMFGHNYREPSIGKVLDIATDGGRILFKPQFAINESPRAAEIFKLYKGGYLNAFSIGFIPKQREGNVYTETELLEISAVPVPANPNALVVARSEGFDENVIKEIEDMNSELDAIKALADEVWYKGEEIARLKTQIEKSVQGNPADGTGGGPSARSPQKSGLSMAKVKRILLTVKESTDNALHELKRNRGDN